MTALEPVPAEAHRFRVFISYSHSDKALVIRMAEILERNGLQALWDKDIHPGSPFTDEIKELISRSHLFIPLITEHAQNRPWVHQETGYAQALNIPVLPVALEGQNLPADMIAQLQAITVKPSLEDLADKLRQIDIERLVIPPPQKPHDIVAVADWPETRAEYMIRHIKWVTDQGIWAKVRHRAGSTTFSIPDRDLSDVVWKARDGVFDGKPQRSDYFHSLQREEKRALEQHAVECGCLLIMGHPNLITIQRGLIARRVRLESLLEFFARMTDDKLKIVFLHQPEDNNIVLLGDYFSAESLAPRPGGWLQTIFNSHPPTVYRRMRRFDDEFNELYPKYGLSIENAVAQIREELEKLPQVPQ